MFNGSYAFFRYAIVHWLDHVEGFAQRTDSNASLASQRRILTVDLQRFLLSHFPSLERQRHPKTAKTVALELFKAMGCSFYKPLTQASKLWHDSLQQGTGLHNENYAIFDVINRVCGTLDNAASGNLNAELLGALRTFYGERLFKCRRIDCEFFHRGFQSQDEQDKHRDQHRKVYYCVFPGCSKSLSGFGKKSLLDLHCTEAHGTRPDESEYPVYQKPSAINIKAVIRSGDLDAVKRWAEQFPDHIPSKNLGVKRHHGKNHITPVRTSQLTQFHIPKASALAQACRELEILEFLYPRMGDSKALTCNLIVYAIDEDDRSLLDWALQQPLSGVSSGSANLLIERAITSLDDVAVTTLLNCFRKKEIGIRTNKLEALARLTAKHGFLRSLQSLLDDWGVVLTCDAEQERTALMDASEQGRLAVVRFLTERQSVETTMVENSRGESAPKLAAANGHENTVRLLIRENSESMENFLNICRLRQASKAGDTETVRRLLAGPIECDLRDRDHYTPFLHAVEHSHYKIVDLLLKHKGKISVNINRGCYGHHDRLKSHDNGSNTYRDVTAIVLATLNGDTRMVRRLLAHPDTLLDGLFYFRGPLHVNFKLYSVRNIARDLELNEIFDLLSRRRWQSYSESDGDSSDPGPYAVQEDVEEKTVIAKRTYHEFFNSSSGEGSDYDAD